MPNCLFLRAFFQGGIIYSKQKMDPAKDGDQKYLRNQFRFVELQGGKYKRISGWHISKNTCLFARMRHGKI